MRDDYFRREFMDEKRFGDGLKGRGQKDEIKGLGEGELKFPQRLVLD